MVSLLRNPPTIKRADSFWDVKYDFHHHSMPRQSNAKKCKVFTQVSLEEEESREDIIMLLHEEGEARARCKTPAHQDESRQSFWSPSASENSFQFQTPDPRTITMLEPPPLLPKAKRHPFRWEDLRSGALPMLPSLDHFLEAPPTSSPKLAPSATIRMMEVECDGEDVDASLASLTHSAMACMQTQENTASELGTALSALRLKHISNPAKSNVVSTSSKPETSELKQDYSAHQLNAVLKRASFKSDTMTRPVAKDGLSSSALPARRKTIQIAMAA
jgi:hypothetical protein